MDVITIAQWTRIVLYSLIGIIAYLNAITYKGVMRVHRQTVGLLSFTLAAAVGCNAISPELSPAFAAIFLTPLIAFFFVLELIILINHIRNGKPHRRIDD